jgi:hypothetical protein
MKGKFKTKRNFLDFINVLDTNVKILTKKAKISSEYFTQVFESTFELEIFDDCSVNFTDLSKTWDHDTMKRFLDDIDNMEVVNYNNMYVIKNLKFYDNDIEYLLSVDKEKPFNVLKELISKIDKSKNELYVEDDQNNDIDNYKEVSTEINKNFNKEIITIDLDNRISLLKEQITLLENEINSLKSNISNSTNKVEAKIKELKNLKKRLNFIDNKIESNNHFFYISELQKSDIELDKDTIDIINKICKKTNLNTKYILDILKDNYYLILIGNKENYKSFDEKLYYDIIKFDLNGKFELHDNMIKYTGELNWHDLIDIFIKNGFELGNDFKTHAENIINNK